MGRDVADALHKSRVKNAESAVPPMNDKAMYVVLVAAIVAGLATTVLSVFDMSLRDHVALVVLRDGHQAAHLADTLVGHPYRGGDGAVLRLLKGDVAHLILVPR